MPSIWGCEKALQGENEKKLKIFPILGEKKPF
jgi:hypothetical protein